MAQSEDGQRYDHCAKTMIFKQQKWGIFNEIMRQ